MRVIATKRAHPKYEWLGYLQAVMVESEGTWRVADERNLPDRGEVFIHSKFSEGVDKFRPNELIVCDADELDNPDTGDCLFGATGTKCAPLKADEDICTIVNLDFKLPNKDIINAKSRLRPLKHTFVKTFTEEEGEVIAGPLYLVNANFDADENIWSCRLAPGLPNLEFPDLNEYEVYVIPTAALPENTIITGNLFHSKNKSLAHGLSTFIKESPVKKRSIIGDDTLIRILDDALNKNSKLGRKGKKEAVAQVEASKTLKDSMKPALLDLFERMEQLDVNQKRVMEDVFSTYKLKWLSETVSSDTNISDLEDTSSKLRRELENTKQELEDSKQAQREAEGQLRMVTIAHEKNRSLDPDEYTEKINEYNKQIKNLEDELESYKEIETQKIEIKELDARTSNLKKDIDELSESKSGLTETVQRLKSELVLTTGQFREKALSVLPFLEIMNNIKSDTTQKAREDTGQPITKFTPQNFKELVNELSNRVKNQGYQAEREWLNLVSTLYLSVKFIGFFGSPGAGKTTLATCYSNAFGIEKTNYAIVKVGRGWSSFVDFVGYDNSFTGTFKYKDMFYKNFESSNNLDKDVFYSIIFDEATLSSPEFYLSTFITDTDLPNSDDEEAINLDGHTIYLPRDMRLILTFNVDETTEQLSDRFISRMPIVFLSNTGDSDLTDDIAYSTSLPLIDKKRSDELIKGCLEETEDSESLEAIRQVYETRVSYWKNILPEKKLERRKIKQIEKFFNLSAHLDITPEVIVDFVEMVFLMPHVKGDGQEYYNALEQTIRKVESTEVQNRLAAIMKAGQKYNIFRHV